MCICILIYVLKYIFVCVYVYECVYGYLLVRMCYFIYVKWGCMDLYKLYEICKCVLIFEYIFVYNKYIFVYNKYVFVFVCYNRILGEGY